MRTSSSAHPRYVRALLANWRYPCGMSQTVPQLRVPLLHGWRVEQAARVPSLAGGIAWSVALGVCAASEVRAVLEDDAASVGPHSADFWVLAAALKRFIDGEGQGSLPLEVINLCTDLALAVRLRHGSLW